MPPAKKYATAGAFRRALEERLKSASMNEQTDLNRLRRQISFDRLLANGGHRPNGAEYRRFCLLQEAAAVSLGTGSNSRSDCPPWILPPLRYSGARYPVEARMDKRIFARFHLDAGIGDVVSPPPEAIVCRDWLGFAGIRCRSK